MGSPHLQNAIFPVLSAWNLREHLAQMVSYRLGAYPQPHLGQLLLSPLAVLHGAAGG